MKLKNKVAIVTGGNSGIGLETARAFSNEGAKVIIIGRNQKALDAAEKSIGSNVKCFQGDVSKLADLDRIYAAVKAEYGKVDIIFANAGVAEVATVTEATEAHFDKIFDINVKGLFFTVQKALPFMNDGGAIILNSSIAGIIGAPGLSVYSATKAAVRSFARTWTQDLKERKIRVNCVSPGPIETPIFDKMGLPQAAKDDFLTHIVSDVPLGRMGKSEEIAKAVVFLASDDSSYITGTNLVVDGGTSQV